VQQLQRRDMLQEFNIAFRFIVSCMKRFMCICLGFVLKGTYYIISIRQCELPIFSYEKRKTGELIQGSDEHGRA
jgi:hypothetical protein